MEIDPLARLRPLGISPARREALKRAKTVYDQDLSSEEIEAIQCRLFNAQWQQALTNHVFYRAWQTDYRLPSEVSSIKEIQRFPVLAKAEIREREDLVFAESSRATVYATGGTTAEPTLFPRGSVEGATQWADNYVGRTWWGIGPTDRSVLVWGHSHLYGSGWKRHVRWTQRAVKDTLTATLRLDGYRLAPEESRRHLTRLLAYRPAYVIGYASALVRLARAADESSTQRLRDLHLKGIIATAETLDDYDLELLATVFGAPVIVEYGAAELGVIAMSRQRSREIKVLWRSNFVTQSPDHGVLVTSLQRRQFPLINYALGDRVLPTVTTSGGSILSLSHVEGRTLDLLTVGGTNGEVVVSALQLTHILKGHPSVHAVQFSQTGSASVTVYLKLDDDTHLTTVSSYLRRLFQKEYPTLLWENVSLVAAADQLHSRAGKHLVMRPAPSVGDGEGH